MQPSSSSRSLLTALSKSLAEGQLPFSVYQLPTGFNVHHPNHHRKQHANGGGGSTAASAVGSSMGGGALRGSFEFGPDSVDLHNMHAPHQQHNTILSALPQSRFFHHHPHHLHHLHHHSPGGHDLEPIREQASEIGAGTERLDLLDSRPSDDVRGQVTDKGLGPGAADGGGGGLKPGAASGVSGLWGRRQALSKTSSKLRVGVATKEEKGVAKGAGSPKLVKFGDEAANGPAGSAGKAGSTDAAAAAAARQGGLGIAGVARGGTGSSGAADGVAYAEIPTGMDAGAAGDVGTRPDMPVWSELTDVPSPRQGSRGSGVRVAPGVGSKARGGRVRDSGGSSSSGGGAGSKGSDGGSRGSGSAAAPRADIWMPLRSPRLLQQQLDLQHQQHQQHQQQQAVMKAAALAPQPEFMQLLQGPHDGRVPSGLVPTLAAPPIMAPSGAGSNVWLPLRHGGSVMYGPPAQPQGPPPQGLVPQGLGPDGSDQGAWAARLPSPDVAQQPQPGMRRGPAAAPPLLQQRPATARARLSSDRPPGSAFSSADQPPAYPALSLQPQAIQPSQAYLSTLEHGPSFASPLPALLLGARAASPSGASASGSSSASLSAAAPSSLPLARRPSYMAVLADGPFASSAAQGAAAAAMASVERHARASPRGSDGYGYPALLQQGQQAAAAAAVSGASAGRPSTAYTPGMPLLPAQDRAAYVRAQEVGAAAAAAGRRVGVVGGRLFGAGSGSAYVVDQQSYPGYAQGQPSQRGMQYSRYSQAGQLYPQGVPAVHGAGYGTPRLSSALPLGQRHPEPSRGSRVASSTSLDLPPHLLGAQQAYAAGGLMGRASLPDLPLLLPGAAPLHVAGPGAGLPGPRSVSVNVPVGPVGLAGDWLSAMAQGRPLVPPKYAGADRDPPGGSFRTGGGNGGIGRFGSAWSPRQQLG